MLHELQTSFLRGIYNKSLENIAYLFIKETSGKSAEQQLSIYRGSIFGGLKKALAETYPVTKELVGEDFFNMMLGQYIKYYPCQVQDLNDYGKELAEFIQGLKQVRSVPYLAEVAELEWFYNVCLNSEMENNNLEEISLLNDEQQGKIKFNFPKGTGLICVTYPVDLIWDSHVNSSEKDIDLNKECVYLIIWKNVTNVEINRLSDKQFYFLKNIKDESSFSNVCLEFLNKYPNANVTEMLADVIQQGWLRRFSIF